MNGGPFKTTKVSLYLSGIVLTLYHREVSVTIAGFPLRPYRTETYWYKHAQIEKRFINPPTSGCIRVSK
jgi:hypothetical protein